MRKSFTQQVFDELADLSGEDKQPIDIARLSDSMMIQTGKGHRKMLKALSEMSIAGKVTRVKQGVYVPAPSGKPKINQVMWRLLRMRRRVTIDDLVEMAGASEGYAQEWLAMLTSKGLVRRHLVGDHPPVWQLIADTVEMPENEEKAERLRKWRAKQRAEMAAALDEAAVAIDKARKALESFDS